MRTRYGLSVRREDWSSCRDIAHRLLTKDLSEDERSEALFALGFAQEKLENVEEAKHSYKAALGFNPHHEAVLKHLRWLDNRKKT